MTNRLPDEMMASYISYFMSGSKQTFPCHKSVPKSDDRNGWSPWQDGQVLCVGGLMLAAKIRQYSNVVLHALSLGWYHPSQHTPEELACVFDTPLEMVEASNDEV